MEDRLEQYRNYLQSIQYHQEYGDKYGDTKELIKMYERKLNVKAPYIWDYTIRVKTKEGTFEYEKETLDNLDLLLQQHQDYEEVRAEHNKQLVKKRGYNGATKYKKSN